MPQTDAIVRVQSSGSHRVNGAVALALVGVSLFSVVTTQVAGLPAAQAATSNPVNTGFAQPFAGTPRYQRFAAAQTVSCKQLNQPIGQAAADRLAKELKLSKKHTFTAKQYRLFISGRGVGGNRADAKLVDQSVRILTNTVGRPLIYTVDGHKRKSVLGSYGLMVNKSGMLESPANTDAPTRQVNAVLAPSGYFDVWSKANGASRAILSLYASAFTGEAVHGSEAQAQSGVAQLVSVKKGKAKSTVGMPMAPALWITNFALIYTLNPSLAALMPARWAPIPPRVARAIKASPTGQVPFTRYASAFHNQ